jgi:hypothetical protein
MNKAYLVVNGGLGNQMGQAAFGIALEQVTGAQILYKIDQYRDDEPYRRTFLLHKYFPRLRRIEATQGPSGAVPTFTEPLHVPDPARMLSDAVAWVSENRESIIDGYWLHEEYQRGYEQLFRDYFSPDELGEKTRSEGRSLRATDHIGIHVRRSDYGHHGLARMSYYRDCLAEIRKEKGNVPAIVFTDEYNFCCHEFRRESNLTVVKGDVLNPINDFYLLSCCKHYILSNSSFASWAAKLGQAEDSIVYVPLPLCIFVPNWTVPGRWRLVQDATQRQ